MTKIQRGETTHLHHGICNTPYQANRALGVLSQMFNLAQQCGHRPLSEEAEAAILAHTLGHSVDRRPILTPLGPVKSTG